MYLKTSSDLGMIVRAYRKTKKLRQSDLAKLCSVGTRFIVDLEKGKPTCELNKALSVAINLGIDIEIQETSVVSAQIPNIINNKIKETKKNTSVKQKIKSLKPSNMFISSIIKRRKKSS